MYEIPSSPKPRLFTVRRVMFGMITLLSAQFVTGYTLTNWRCGSCNDPHIHTLFIGAALVGVGSFVGSIIYWHELGDIQRLTGVLLPLLFAGVWYATVMAHLLYW